MQSFSRIALATAAMTISAFAPNPVRAQALPPAASIIAKYVSAIGGKDEIMKITSFKQIGSMEVPAVGLSAPIEMYAAAPNKMSMKMSIPGMGEMLNGFNGTVGWDVNPMNGPRLLSDKELATSRENADFYASLLYSADRFASMETVGDTTINGEKAYRVKFVKKETKSESVSFFSATTGLLLGGVSTQDSQMGPLTTSQTVSEYKKFGAILMPTKIEQQLGPQKMVINIKDVIMNGAPESAFEVPAQVKPLIKP